MKLHNKITGMIIGAFTLVIGCCEEDAPKPFVCGCEARPTDTTFSDIPSLVVLTSKGFYLLNIERGLINTCNTLPIEYQQDGLMVDGSGTVKATCEMAGNPYHINETWAKIDQISIANDSVFNGEGYTLKIIRSEDYGYDPGFGYAIIFPDGPDLVQPHQPAISGFQPFRTRLDAYTVAGLVLYKIANGLHPAIAQEDLVMLGTL
jgi:hypothetical protein